jgi:transposase
VKGNKNDSRDAEASCEAVSRPHMRFVPLKTVESQDVQAIHRLRSRLIKERTALGNQIRGLLAERGIIIPQGITRLRTQLPMIVEDRDNALTPLSREVRRELYEELVALDERIAAAVPGQLAGGMSSVPTESREESEVVDLQGVGRTDAGAAS